VMTTWKRGRSLLEEARALVPLQLLVDDVTQRHPARTAGTSAFLTSDPTRTPLALLHYFKHVKVLPESVIVLGVEFLSVPRAEPDEIGDAEPLGAGLWRVRLRFGFMEVPDVPAALDRLWTVLGLTLPSDVTYVVGRDHLLGDGPGKMARWRKVLFVALSHQVPTVTNTFQIPPNRVVELGAQMRL
jgi:KUP system potassium uptake protein